MIGFIVEEEEEVGVVRVDARRGRRMVDDRVMVGSFWVVLCWFVLRGERVYPLPSSDAQTLGSP